MNGFEDTVAKIQPLDPGAMDEARTRLDQLTMPHWALGRLMDLALELAGMTCYPRPRVADKTIVVMAGDHGVAGEDVSLYPQEVTLQMVYNFVAGGAGINALARLAGADVLVVDMGVKGDLSELAQAGKIRRVQVGPGTFNLAQGPAMSREQAVQCVEAGIAIALELAETTDVFGTGDMGIGNTTPSSAVVAALTGLEPEAVTGCGTGIDEEKRKRKAQVVARGLEVNMPDPLDGMDVLAKVGGFEIGGIAGLILGAASVRKPVVIDGFISTAGALIAHSLCPGCADYMIAAHKSVERGHAAALERLGKIPFLDLNMRLGEGTGAALAMNIVEGAVRVLTDVATFAEAGVTEA